MNLTIMQTAWLIYGGCGLGLCLATWWMFLWAWRFVRYSAVVTVLTLLFTPYAIDQQTMQMAPAIYTLVFNGMALGFEAILPIIKLMLGIWGIGVILMGVFVLLTRKSDVYYTEPAVARTARDSGNNSRAANSRAASDRAVSDRSGSDRAANSRSSTERSSARQSSDRSADSRSSAQSSKQSSKPPSKKKTKQNPPAAPRKEYFPMDNLSREERQAREEMLHGDIPMRAIRD